MVGRSRTSRLKYGLRDNMGTTTDRVYLLSHTQVSNVFTQNPLVSGVLAEKERKENKRPPFSVSTSKLPL